MSDLVIGDRVRLRGYRVWGTVAANPYTFRTQRIGVRWDHSPGRIHCLDLAEVVRAAPIGPLVPPDARPIAIGAMAGGRLR